MTAREVLETVVLMPQKELMKIQCGIAELITARLSTEEIAEIRGVLGEAEAEFERDKSMSSEAIRRQLGLL